jgi:hypothetical protein
MEWRMKTLTVFLLFLFGASRCEKGTEVPCAQALIAKIKKEAVRNPPAEIWEYIIDGENTIMCRLIAAISSVTCMIPPAP